MFLLLGSHAPHHTGQPAQRRPNVRLARARANFDQEKENTRNKENKENTRNKENKENTINFDALFSIKGNTRK